MAFAFKKRVFDGANVEYDDPTIDINPKALEEWGLDPNNKHCESESDLTYPVRRGTKSFFSPGTSIQGKMAAENYYKHVRPLQGSLTTMDASKSINSRYVDIVRSHITKFR